MLSRVWEYLVLTAHVFTNFRMVQHCLSVFPLRYIQYSMSFPKLSYELNGSTANL